jgi:hypothetical protein
MEVILGAHGISLSQVFVLYCFEREIRLPCVGKTLADGALDVAIVKPYHFVHILGFMGLLSFGSG